MDRTVSTAYAVEGMTCGHCVASVEEEVAEIAGVSAASADLDSGRLEVAGSGFSDEQVAQAVALAGYTLAGRA